MSFLPIDGTSVYVHQKPSSTLYKAATAERNGARLRAANLLLLPYIAIFVYLVASIVFTFDVPSWASWTAAIAALVALLVGRALRNNHAAIKRMRELILKGEYRDNFVIPTDYSYGLVLTQPLRDAMTDDRVKQSVDALLGNLVMVMTDESIRAEKIYDVSDFDPGIIGHVYQEKLGVIGMTERLYEGLGIKLPAHFEEVRASAKAEFDEGYDRMNQELEQMKHLR